MGGELGNNGGEGNGRKVGRNVLTRLFIPGEERGTPKS